MARKIYRTWDDIPPSFRKMVMKVITLNKISFNKSSVRSVQTDVWRYRESSDNGRLRYYDETCANIYRLPDIENTSIYVAIDYDGWGYITIDFYDNLVGRASYIAITGGVYR